MILFRGLKLPILTEIFCLQTKGFLLFLHTSNFNTKFTMKILVAISNVPDTTAKISFANGDSEFNAAGTH